MPPGGRSPKSLAGLEHAPKRTSPLRRDSCAALGSRLANGGLSKNGCESYWTNGRLNSASRRATVRGRATRKHWRREFNETRRKSLELQDGQTMEKPTSIAPR